MTCTACGHENRVGRKFCAECGAALALACATCGTPHDAGEKFCGECGAALGSAAQPQRSGSTQPASARASSDPRADAGTRKVVTIVFADLVGSTSLHERLDAESARLVMDRYYAVLRAAVDSHGGTVVKLLGDGVMAAFGLRQVAEDDAIRAVHAAVAMQEAFRELVGSQAALDASGLRVGVNTGEVVVSGAEDDVIGDPVNVAARLQEQCRDGDVVIGEATRRLVAARVTLVPLGSVALKGRAEAVAAYRVESLEAPPSATAAPFVGREDEINRLLAAYDAAVATPATRLAVLLGSPGLGKSRLISELASRLGDAATVLTAHCDAAGRATFAPLATALRACLGIDATAGSEVQRETIEAALGDDADRPRIAAGIVALLASSPASPEETFFVVRRLLVALARRRPLVLVIDDVHWAEPLLLDLIEHLVQWGSGVPLFVLVGARPELRDLRSALVIPGSLVSEVVTLGGLDAGAAMRLAANVIGAADLPAAVAAKVLATSEGNPLFVGELVRMLVQEGALIKDGERWTAGAGLASIEMPPTIHALLAARIERLRPEERTVLERASVVGRHFSRSAVAALLGRNGSELDQRLESLRRSELIERDSGWLLGEPVLRFHHVLIRDAAYRRLLKGTRAELHERLADWIEGRVGDAAEHDETIGWHLEQAHQHLRELGTLDAHANALGERAATRLAAAGRRALARDDVPLAAGLLGRAIDRLDKAEPRRADLALDWCEALLAAGEVAHAATAIDELARFTEGSARLSAWHACFAAQLAVMTAPEELHAAAERVAAAARELAAQDDAAGEAKAHFVHAQALARLGKVGACEAALDQALAAARRGGDRRRANAVLAGAPLAALWGPSPVTRASGRCLDVVRVLRITQGAPAVEAVALSCQGVLEALRGRSEAARRMLASSRSMVEELGITQRLFEVDVFIGRVDLLEGDAAAAERRLRPAYDGLRELGLGIDAACAAALLARAVLAQGRVAEAEQLSEESEQLAGDDLQAAIAWRGVRAESLAARGEHEAAVELAQAAVAIATATDALLDHADARVALAAALRAAGRTDETDDEEHRAVELWEAKGASVLAQRAQQLSSVVTPQVSAQVAPPVVAVDALTAGVSPERSSRRRVPANAATRNIERFDAAFAAHDSEGMKATSSPDLTVIHHPTGSTYGIDGQVETWRGLFGARGTVARHSPLAALGDSLALCRLNVSTRGHEADGLSFGPIEVDLVLLNEVDEHGRSIRGEGFASDHLCQATARLYERYAESLPEGPERTRVAGIVRTLSVWSEAVEMARAETIVRSMAPAYVCVDHRSLGTWSSEGREQTLRHWRGQAELAVGFTRRDDDILAFALDAILTRSTYYGTSRASGGPFENVMLQLVVFGVDGLCTRSEIFEPDCEAQALARFDELTGAGARVSALASLRANAATRCLEGFGAAVRTRDSDAIVELLDVALHVVHHPTGTSYGRREMSATWRSVLKAERLSFRNEILASLGDTLALGRYVLSLEGLSESHLKSFGLAEFDEIVLFETGAHGRLVRVEIFAAEQMRKAAARLRECYAERRAADARTSAADSVLVPPNAAARAYDRGLACAEAGDWDVLRTLYAPDMVFDDRRRLFRMRGNIEMAIASIRHVIAGAKLAGTVLATAGDRLMLQRRLWSARNEPQEFEIELLTVFEVDAEDRVIALVVFDPDDRAAASAELFERWAATDGGMPSCGIEYMRAINAQDAVRAGAVLADDLVYEDRRRTGVGRLEGANAYLASMRAWWEIADEWHAEQLRTVTLTPHGGVAILRIWGKNAEGGEFESIIAGLSHIEQGRIARFEVFEPENLDAALARFAELSPDPLRIPPNVVVRTYERWTEVIKGGSAEEIAALYAPSFINDDRRSLIRTVTDRAAEVLNCQHLAQGGGYLTATLLATAGERIALHRGLWTQGGAVAPSEVEYLEVDEVNRDGQFVRSVVFDPDDRTAASAELFERYVAGGEAELLPNAVATLRAWNDHDLVALRSLLPEDVYLDDRRRTGVGRVAGADAYLAAHAAFWELSHDVRLELLYIVSTAAHGVVSVGRWFGTDADGGDFDAVFALIVLQKGDRVAGFEVFEPEDLDAARARFAELG